MDALGRLLQIRRGELGRVALAFLLVLLGSTALVILRTTRDTLFLLSSGTAGLPAMYVAVAIASVAASALYGRLVRGREPGRAAAASFPAYAASLLVLQALGRAGLPGQASILYVHAEVVSVIWMIQVWTLVGEAFDARQAKRLLGLVAGAGTLAGIAGGLATRFLAGALDALLPTAAGLVLAAAPVALALSRASSVAAAGPAPARPLRLLADGYLRRLAALHAGTVLTCCLADYAFKAVARGERSGPALAAFFGTYYAISNTVMLAYSLLLAGRLLPWLGVRGAALVLPLGFLASGSALLAWPSLLLASLVKFGDNGVRYTLHNSALQVLLLPVRAEQRGPARALLDGLVKPLAGGLAGLLLLLPAAIPGEAGVRLAAGLLVTLAGATALVTWPVGQAYLGALLLALRRSQDTLGPVELRDAGTRRLVERELDSADTARVAGALRLADELGLELPAPRLAHALAGADEALARELLARIEARPDPAVAGVLADPAAHPGLVGARLRAFAACAPGPATPRVEQALDDPTQRVDALLAALRHLPPPWPQRAAARALALARSADPAQRAAALDLLGRTGAEGLGEAAEALLGDGQAGERRRVLRACSIAPGPTAAGIVARAAADPRLRGLAVRIAPRVPGAIELLTRQRPDWTAFEQETALLALAREPRPEAAPWLGAVAARASAPLRHLAALVLHRLREEQGLAPQSGVVDLGLARHAREACLLALAAEAVQGGRVLLDEARQGRVEAALHLEAARGAPRALSDLIVALRDPARRAGALEVFDLTLAHPGLRPLLELLDGQPPREVFERHIGPAPEDPLPPLLALDDPLTRAVAMLELRRRGAPGDQRAVDAAFLSPSPALREAAALAQPSGDAMLSLVERVLFLKRADVFGELPGEVLLALARNASEVRFEPSAPIVQAGDPGAGLFVVVSGEVAVERGGVVIARLGPGSCFGELALLDGQPRTATVRARGEVACLGLGRDAFLDLVAEEPELARGLLAVLTRRLRGMIERSGAVY